MYILIVEDDPDVSNFVQSALREAGHRVEMADNAEDGLALAQAKPFELIILDRQLPNGADGLDILKAIRAGGANVPALFLSGLGELSDWVKGLQAGGDDYLVKPVSMDDLLARVAALGMPRAVVPGG